MNASTFKQDLMASFVVFLVALPLCMGIAIASGVPVAAGLITGIVGGLVVGFIAGCPLQVSGPAAGLTVIILDLVREFGLESLGVAVLMAGLLQGAAGLLRLGQWFRAVSPAVVRGMLAGIGVLIIGSQLHVMVDDKPKGNGIENLVTIPQAVAKSFAWPSVQSQESRRFRRDMLQEVGELHRRQQDLEERVAEIYPHVHNPELEYTETQRTADAADLEALAVVQQAIQDDLESATAKLQRLDEHFATPQRAARAAAAADAAVEQNHAALAAFSGGDPAAILTEQDASVAAIQKLLVSLKNHHFAAWVGVLSILSIIGWQFVPKSLKLIPGPLVAVCVGTLIAAAFALPVLYVEIPDRLWEGVHLPSWAVVHETGIAALLKSAILIAVVASAETLLCATAVDQLHNGVRTNYDRELFAQGVGNTVCGVLGVLPMTGVIVRSSANIQAGGQTRASAILHGVWLLLFVAVFGFLLRQIPTACLAAILVYTGFKLVNINDIRKLANYGKSEVLIYFATVITIVAEDLLTGVLVGIALAAFKLLYTFSHLEAHLRTDADNERICRLQLHGAATFIRLPMLAAELEKVPPGCELHVDFQDLRYIDHACLELMMTWAKQHENTGGRLVIDWESLHARFSPVGQSPRSAEAAPR
ncbi:putative sulfate transporter [Posidoniimonas polymericola]|uniref:Putative sulfate transporter n=1 Tax=Posidoniimonas polymericola TaxID=2528002 RepID=A0A5C5ZDV9_9BACT|nr:SulP family inorganic anion transporter [Posidoniimonas polymericola]TWT85358.1 putative sulfate transporter [Posidoniimonas polymericola]